MRKDEKYINILGFKVFNGTKKEALETVFEMGKVHIISGNPEVLYTGLQDEILLKNFKSKESLIIPDGVGTQISAKILNSKLSEKIAGIELMKDIIGKCETTGEGIYLLGASDESLKFCVENLIKEYPKIKILGKRNGFFDLNKDEEIVKDIESKKPKVLFVAMGCPRQEKFIVKNIDKLNVDIFMGVGGSFDVIGNQVKRAPNWMIKIGMEWAYRVIKEPWRIKRLGSIPKFLCLTIKSRKVKE